MWPWLSDPWVDRCALNPSAKKRKSAHCERKEKVRWPYIIHKARASLDNVLTPFIYPPILPPFIHDYVFSTTRTHPCASTIPLYYHLGTQNTGTLARCNKPEDFILAHFSMCGARHVGATSEKSSHTTKFLIHPRFHFTNLTPIGLWWFISNDFD